MFHLVKILNSRSGAPEPMRIPLKTETTAQYGDLVQVFGGNAVRITSAAIVIPTHYVLGKISATEILATPVTPDMIFETTVNGSPESLDPGEEYLLSEDGECIGVISAASGKRGAVIYDKLFAKNAGDAVQVRFL